MEEGTFYNLSICIPAYNEQLAISKTLMRLKEAFPVSEIIVVDDGSTDDTYRNASLIEGIRLIKHTRNKGYGASLKTAIRSASREIIAWFDADGQHRVEDLMEIIVPILNGEKDVVVGARGKESDVRLLRVPGKYVLKLASQFVAGEKIPDLNSGLRCFKKQMIVKYLHLLPDGFSASTTSTLLSIKRGYRLGYVQITTNKREGQSTVKIFRDGPRILKLILRIFVLFDAFKFFTVLAMVQIIPALLYGIIIGLKNKFGFPTLAATVIISGVLTFFMGIITDQIVAIRHERFEQ